MSLRDLSSETVFIRRKLPESFIANSPMVARVQMINDIKEIR